jgi:hypothetical protein
MILKIGKPMDTDEIHMVEKWNEKYGTFIPDKVVPPSAA